MKFNSIGILLILIYSSFGSASSCKDLLSEFILRKNQTSRTYTVPENHIDSEAWAKDVIKASESNEFGINSVWFEFTRDPRFNVPVTSDKPIENAINYLNTSSPPRRVDQTSIESIYKLRNSNKNLEQGSEPNFIVTWRDVGIRAINWLISKKILLVGMIKKGSIVHVDGIELDDIKFTEHDLAHAHGLELLINNSFKTDWGKDSFSSDFFKKFSYEKIIRNLNETQRVLYDIAYYLTFHEGAGYLTFGYNISQISKPVTLSKIQDAYKETLIGIFDIKFDPSIQVTISKRQFESKDPRSIINRFLDENNMLYTLPPEVQSKIRSNPSQAKEIVAEFLAEAFSLFYNYHYDTTLRMLNLR